MTLCVLLPRLLRSKMSIGFIEYDFLTFTTTVSLTLKSEQYCSSSSSLIGLSSKAFSKCFYEPWFRICSISVWFCLSDSFLFSGVPILLLIDYDFISFKFFLISASVWSFFRGGEEFLIFEFVLFSLRLAFLAKAIERLPIGWNSLSCFVILAFCIYSVCVGESFTSTEKWWLDLV